MIVPKGTLYSWGHSVYRAQTEVSVLPSTMNGRTSTIFEFNEDVRPEEQAAVLQALGITITQELIESLHGIPEHICTHVECGICNPPSGISVWA